MAHLGTLGQSELCQASVDLGATDGIVECRKAQR